MMDKDRGSGAEGALKNLSRFSAVTFATTVLRLGIRVLSNVVFTRLLGPSGRGAYGLLTTIPGLVVSLGNMGFGLGNVFLIAKRKCDLRAVTGNTLVVTSILGTVLTLAGYLLLSYGDILKGDTELIHQFTFLVLCAIPFVLLYEFGSDLLIATKQINYVNFLGLIFSGLPVILIIIFWFYTGEALNSAMYAWALTVLVVSVWSILKVMKRDALPLKVSLKHLKEGLSFGSRGYISIFANAMVRRIDFIFISSMLGAKDLGYYAISVSIAEILLSVPDAVNLPFLPLHLGLNRKDAEDTAPVVIRHVLFIMILICLFTAIIGRYAIWILFGKDFLAAYVPLLWLLPGIFSLSIFDLLKIDMYRNNLPGFVSMVSLLTLICNLILNYILIPIYGISGAAISSTVSYSLSTCILLCNFTRIAKVPYRDVLVIKISDLMLLWSQFRYGIKKDK
ncbi:MAG TPA: hypothetical protein ENH40_00510 [Nitrospirae bacterium]|nr:hypothetical protein [Nitrospirota bacterium]